MATLSNRKLQKIITLPINQVFRFFTAREKIEVWLMDRNNYRITGTIRGFDEYMNLVLDDAEELYLNKETDKFDKKVSLGQIMLKGENIVLMAPYSPNISQPPSQPPPVKGESPTPALPVS